MGGFWGEGSGWGGQGGSDQELKILGKFTTKNFGGGGVRVGRGGGSGGQGGCE